MGKTKYLSITFCVSFICLLISYVFFSYQGFNKSLGELISIPVVLIFGAGYGGGKFIGSITTIVVFLALWGFISLMFAPMWPSNKR
ncbi:MAG: hypothetical protein ACI8YQ_002886 [Polaribacter sp.]